RLLLEGLEDRVQPSVFSPIETPVETAAPTAVAVSATMQFRVTGPEITPLATLNSATYITGAPGVATAKAVATDRVSGDAVVVGTYNDGSNPQAVIVAKYTGGVMDMAHQAYLTAFTLGDMDSTAQGVAIDSMENIFICGGTVVSGTNIAYVVKLDPM